jgi:hypothetical protein
LGEVIHIVNIALKAWEKSWLEPLGHALKDDSRTTHYAMFQKQNEQAGCCALYISKLAG